MQVLEKTLRALVIGGIFLLPFVCLIVATSLFFPFITGKNFMFRIVVEVITAAWLALALVDAKYRPRRSWILGAFAVFVILIAIADAQGANPFKSFWSNFERMDGWVTLAHLLAYIVVAASVMNTEKLWRRLFEVSLAISAFVAIYGFLQIGGALALGGGGSGGLNARIDATFGNPIYLAVYMLFHIFIAAYLWHAMWKERRPGARLALSLLYGFVIALDTIALLFTGTRGTTLGLIGGAGLALVLFACSSEASKTFRTVTVAVIAAGIICAGGLWAARDTAFVHSVGFLDRLSTISASDGTIKARFLNMGVAWQGVKERPLLGWGQENYAIVFDKYYDPRMYGDEPWFDRVHDIIFDWLIAGGFFGLISYFSIFAAALWLLWKGKAFSGAERALFTGLLAGYTIHNLTVFDNITSYILFGTILAYISWRAAFASESSPLITRPLFPRNSLPFVTIIAALFLWGIAWWVNAGALAQNRTILAALSSQQSGAQQNLALFKEAISYGAYGTQEAREQLAQGTSKIASSQNVTNDVKQQFFNTAVSEMTLQEAASPLDARFPLFLGILESSFGDYTDAANNLAKAHELSPRKQTILFEVALNQQAQGNVAGALQTFKTAFDLEPDYGQARILYAAAAIQAGQDSLADQLLAPFISTGAAADPHITSAYLARKEYSKIVTIWAAHVKAQPDDVQGYFTLAAAYYASGNSAQAIATLQHVEVVSPDVVSQANALIEQIRNGTASLGQ